MVKPPLASNARALRILANDQLQHVARPDDQIGFVA